MRYVAPEERREGIPIVQLFRGGRAAWTALLWAVNFMNVLDAYFVASWLPTVVREAGHETSTAVLVGTAVQTGGAIGTIVLGLVLQRVSFVPVLAACFATAAASLVLVGQPGLPLAALAGVAFLAGWATFGGQPGLNALAATHYPTDLRSPGLGAALGVGRFGAILGPLVAGAVMLYYGLTTEKRVFVRNDLVGSVHLAPMMGDACSRCHQKEQEVQPLVPCTKVVFCAVIVTERFCCPG